MAEPWHLDIDLGASSDLHPAEQCEMGFGTCVERPTFTEARNTLIDAMRAERKDILNAIEFVLRSKKNDWPQR